MIRLAGLFKTVSKKGEVYFTGKDRDGTRYLLFKNKKDGNTQPDYNLYMAKNEALQTKPEIDANEIKSEINEDDEYSF